MTAHRRSQLTLGPLLFHWSGRARRDFYFRIADEAPIEVVYLGEVVCSKRESAFEPYREAVIARLLAAHKAVVHSTLALVTTPQELEQIASAAGGDTPVEANDVACLRLLGGRRHVVGPYINVFNEGSRDVLIRNGATRIVLPVEIPARSIEVVARTDGQAEIELQVFGRQPLSVAMRCYHARAHDRTKDHCQLVCGLDADGLTASTLDGSDILTVNGTQTLTHGHAVLLQELGSLQSCGVTHYSSIVTSSTTASSPSKPWRHCANSRRQSRSSMASCTVARGWRGLNRQHAAIGHLTAWDARSPTAPGTLDRQRTHQ